MHSCIISLAANCNQKENLAEARQRLGQILFDVQYTRELWTKPVSSSVSTPTPARQEENPSEFKQEENPSEYQQEENPSECKYLNQLAYAHTELECDKLEQALKAMEREMGRTDADRRQGIVRIDLDLMKYDDTRHHTQDWERPYITELLRQEVEHQ